MLCSVHGFSCMDHHMTSIVTFYVPECLQVPTCLSQHSKDGGGGTLTILMIPNHVTVFLCISLSLSLNSLDLSYTMF